MISKSTEIVLPTNTKITTVWSFIKGLTAATVHYYAHESGTEEWWEATQPGRVMEPVTDMPERLWEYEQEKTIIINVGVHYIVLIAEKPDFIKYLTAFEERFTCQILHYSR